MAWGKGREGTYEERMRRSFLRAKRDVERRMRESLRYGKPPIGDHVAMRKWARAKGWKYETDFDYKKEIEINPHLYSWYTGVRVKVPSRVLRRKLKLRPLPQPSLPIQEKDAPGMEQDMDTPTNNLSLAPHEPER